jgi:hypothetical protein
MQTHETTPAAVRPFHINVPEEDLVELRRRVLATRWPDREEVRPFGVDVSLIEPAFVKTHLVSKPPTNLITAYTQGRQAAMHVLSRSVESGMEPRAVAQVILRAATTRPRLRYPVGRDAQGLMLLKRLLPEPLFERVRRRVFRTGNPADQEPRMRPGDPATS